MTRIVFIHSASQFLRLCCTASVSVENSRVLVPGPHFSGLGSCVFGLSKPVAARTKSQHDLVVYLIESKHTPPHFLPSAQVSNACHMEERMGNLSHPRACALSQVSKGFHHHKTPALLQGIFTTFKRIFTTLNESFIHTCANSRDPVRLLYHTLCFVDFTYPRTETLPPPPL